MEKINDLLSSYTEKIAEAHGESAEEMEVAFKYGAMLVRRFVEKAGLDLDTSSSDEVVCSELANRADHGELDEHSGTLTEVAETLISEGSSKSVPEPSSEAVPEEVSPAAETPEAEASRDSEPYDIPEEADNADETPVETSQETEGTAAPAVPSWESAVFGNPDSQTGVEVAVPVIDAPSEVLGGDEEGLPADGANVPEESATEIPDVHNDDERIAAAESDAEVPVEEITEEAELPTAKESEGGVPGDTTFPKEVEPTETADTPAVEIPVAQVPQRKEPEPEPIQIPKVPATAVPEVPPVPTVPAETNPLPVWWNDVPKTDGWLGAAGKLAWIWAEHGKKAWAVALVAMLALGWHLKGEGGSATKPSVQQQGQVSGDSEIDKVLAKRTSIDSVKETDILEYRLGNQKDTLNKSVSELAEDLTAKSFAALESGWESLVRRYLDTKITVLSKNGERIYLEVPIADFLRKFKKTDKR